MVGVVDCGGCCGGCWMLRWKFVLDDVFTSLMLTGWMFVWMQDQLLGHWVIQRKEGSSEPISYKFPPKFTLKAGSTVTVSLSVGLDFSDF